MIETIYGPMDEKLLAKGKKTGGYDNGNETTEWVEYWIEGVLVHRSVDIKLKKGVFFEIFGCNSIPPALSDPGGKEYRKQELLRMGVKLD